MSSGCIYKEAQFRPSDDITRRNWKRNQKEPKEIKKNQKELKGTKRKQKETKGTKLNQVKPSKAIRIQKDPKGTKRNQTNKTKLTIRNQKVPKRNQTKPNQIISAPFSYTDVVKFYRSEHSETHGLKLRSRNSSTTIGNVLVVGSAGKKQQIGVVNKQHFF
jgi:hypothetical protein